MTGHEVEQNFDSARVSLLKQLNQILVCAIARSYALVIADVVACVHKRRIVDRIEPNRVTAEVLYIVELLNNTLQITDTVAVAVVKALGINLIKYCVVKPVRHKITLSTLLIDNL